LVVMRLILVSAGLLIAVAFAAPALAGGVEALRVAQDTPAATGVSPYLPGSPVWSSPYVRGPVLGGVFYDGPSDQSLGARIFAPAPGISCSLRRHACWTPTGIDRGWTARFFGLKS
jgi:hypothetical protein